MGEEISKEWFRSKRFWAGIVMLVTGIGTVSTGDKTWIEALPMLIMTGIGIVQAILGIATNTPVAFGSRVVGQK